MLNIAVLVSGGGTNLQALLDAEKRGELDGGKISLVLSSSPTAYALERAKAYGVDTAVLERKKFADAAEYDKALLSALTRQDIGLVVLAGFLCILGNETLNAYKRRIINVHPSLIPAFCGDGFYGLRVHEAALKKGVKVSGATVHFVTNVVDGGEIIMQKAVDVLPNDTAQSLQRRVMEQAEWELLPKAVTAFIRHEI
ncbi:MAG: phosphoribosylglycinamide formyltransferase [Hydrogenoanaerobacterium sp.]